MSFTRGEEDHFLGGMMFNLVASEMIVAAFVFGVAVLTWPHPPWNVLFGLGVALMIGAPFALYPVSKSLWLALDLYIRPVAD